MNHPLSTTAPASTLPDRAITASLTVEIMHDLDNGRPTLLISRDSNQGDLCEVTPFEAIAEASKLRADADRIEELAREYAAKHVIPALVEHYGITLRETSLDQLHATGPEIADMFMGYGMRLPSGELVFVVPEGQDPIERIGFIRGALRGINEQAAAA
ncbi:hypothetical protein PV729_26730 [Streptomyces europaeiscabiei]|uniref:Uncharacterized protein n=1 Tax=Streptomyces europaeiscabiei TaxID=146819 RepID=A0ABU4NQG2_9ACTN|nr:hypothetical protein [Streptomyces europaeiscabiei]MDX2771437.1 hypothetical protein [Streptomyces europaeiscabiei]MDX3555319.1 hypothetical protein [Streptomyces europaeiscabiei]MDX3705333.1 hypothetical protein [Streptomyces europaeiscabiei]